MSDQSAAPTGATPDPAEEPREGRWQAFRRLPRAVRWGAWTAVAVVLLLVVLAATVVGVVRRPLPQTDGEVSVPGLTSSVEVLRDDHGIPQLYADNDADLMRAWT